MTSYGVNIRPRSILYLSKSSLSGPDDSSAGTVRIHGIVATSRLAAQASSARSVRDQGGWLRATSREPMPSRGVRWRASRWPLDRSVTSAGDDVGPAVLYDPVS